jgi:hypothetical protein
LLSSPQKIRWLYGLALKRRDRLKADDDLQFLRLATTAIAAKTKEGLQLWRSTERSLMRRANPAPENQKANLSRLRAKVLKAGAKTK